MSATENFEIRTYGKSELAMLYFPKALTPQGALSNLNFWIRTNKELVNALRQCGMPPKAKSYTPPRGSPHRPSPRHSVVIQATL